VAAGLEDTDLAIEDCDWLIEHEPTLRADAYAARGDTRSLEGEVYDAIADYGRALEEDPELASAYLSRGELYFWMGEGEDALADAESLIELEPEEAGGYFLKAKILASDSDYEGVVDACSQALELDPEHAEAYDYRGWAYSNLGEMDLALADLDKAIELDPELFDAYIDRYPVYEALGRTEEAIADLEMMLTLTDDLDDIATIEDEIARLESTPPEVDGYRTYVNATYAFSFTYPADWAIAENVQGALVVVERPTSEMDLFATNMRILSEPAEGQELDEMTDSFIELFQILFESLDVTLSAREEVLLDGQPARLVVMDLALEEGGDPELRIVLDLCLVNDQFYGLAFYLPSDDYAEIWPEMEAIIDTFRFLE
jgi:tetratricopeptide (TPR) repeat protein